MQDKGFCQFDYSKKKILLPAGTDDWKYGQVNTLLNSGSNLWIATQDSGLLEYNGTIKTIKFQDEKITNINSMIQDDQGNIWLSNNEKLIRISPNELIHYPLYSKQVFENIHALLVDNENNIWISTAKTIIKYYKKDNSFISTNYNIIQLDDKTDITSLYQDIYNNIWIGTMGKGLFILHPKTGTYRPITEIENTGSTNILSITGKGNSVCAGSLEGALVFELSPVNQNISAPYSFASFNTDIGSNYIYSVFKDSKNRIWFATDGKGITVLDNGKYINYDSEKYLKDDHIYSITEDRQNNIWFSTSNAGIYKFDGKKFTNYNTSNGLSDINITTIKTDKQGNIIIVHKTGFDILEPQTGNISYINNIQGLSKLSSEIGTIALDNALNIYFSTSNGVVQYSPEAVSIKKTKNYYRKCTGFFKRY
jgi:ligand-binding sensor domain-containing protein